MSSAMYARHKEITRQLYENDYFNYLPNVEEGEDYFIIGCSIHSFEESQRIEILKDNNLNLNCDRFYESFDGEHQLAPQLIFSMNAQSSSAKDEISLRFEAYPNGGEHVDEVPVSNMSVETMMDHLREIKKSFVLYDIHGPE